MQPKPNNKPKTPRQKLLDSDAAVIGEIFADADSEQAREKVQAMLDFFAPKASRWSMQNSRLVAMQKPGCEYPVTVGEARKLGHRVKEGAQCASILVPVFLGDRERGEVPDETESTERPVVEDLRENQGAGEGEAVQEVRPLLFFRAVACVVDLGVDTTGPKVEFMRAANEEAIAERCAELTENLAECIRARGVAVDFAVKGSQAGGYAAKDGSKIGVSPHLAESQKLSVLAHEYSHLLLHSDKSFSGKRSEKAHKDREIEAEMSAYIVGRHFGVQSEYSGIYLTQHRAKPEDLMRNFNSAGKAAKTIIQELSERMKIDMREVRVDAQELAQARKAEAAEGKKVIKRQFVEPVQAPKAQAPEQAPTAAEKPAAIPRFVRRKIAASPERIAAMKAAAQAAQAGEGVHV